MLREKQQTRFIETNLPIFTTEYIGTSAGQSILLSQFKISQFIFLFCPIHFSIPTFFFLIGLLSLGSFLRKPLPGCSLILYLPGIYERRKSRQK